MDDSINLIKILKNIPNNVDAAVSYLPAALIGFAVVMAELALIAVAVTLLSKLVRLIDGGKRKSEPAPSTSEAPLPENLSAGELELVGTDEPTAAVIMAITSSKSGVPLNRLKFKSIKRIEDRKI